MSVTHTQKGYYFQTHHLHVYSGFGDGVQPVDRTQGQDKYTDTINALWFPVEAKAGGIM